MAVSVMAILLIATLAVMLHYTRKAVKEEALNKANQTLEETVQRIDNILLSVEQTSGNFYFKLVPLLGQPEQMYIYSRKLVETNPYVDGCAIAFKPGFYKEDELFMAYYHRDGNGSIVQATTFADTPYTEQAWFTQPIAEKRPCWDFPLDDQDVKQHGVDKHIITFSIPFTDTSGQTVGVIGVDVALDHLSQIISQAKPSEHSYCTLLDNDGSFIVHHNDDQLIHKSVFSITDTLEDPATREAAEAMVKGETGYKQFTLDGKDYYIFFKPFERTAVPGRSTERLGWSAGIVYPEDDIFGDYNRLLYYVLAIATAGLLLLLLLCHIIIHRQLLPLRMLAKKAQRIAQGHYDEEIPDSKQDDEIGRLQDNFQQMQQSLAANIGELEQLTTTLQERGEGLRKAYKQAQKADRMKTAFLHNMTNQMVAPAEAILKDVNKLMVQKASLQESSLFTTEIANDIVQNGDTIAELLKNFINLSDEEGRV